MKILSCRAQHGSYLELTLENDLVYSIHREIAAKYDLLNLSEISEETLQQILFDNDVRRGFQRALYLLDRQGYSYQMMFRKLNQNYQEEVCYAIMNKLCDIGAVNDWKYAESAAQKAAEVKRYGPRRISQILYQKGIPKTVIDKTLLPYMDEELQIENILWLLNRKYEKLLTDPDDRQKVEKCKAALVRMGYGFSVISEAVRIYFENQEE